MEFIEDFEKRDNHYTQKIKKSKYTEGNMQIVEKGKEDICEIIIGKNEINYESMEENQKKQFIVSSKLDIASLVKKDDKYIHSFSPSLIQKGLQETNALSSILYLNEFYKVKCIIFNQDTGKYYQTTMREYEPLICSYKNGTWFLGKEELTINEYSDINDLSHILTMDTDWMIFKPYLKPLAKYKVKELEQIANELSISLKDNQGKKKLKKQLYDEINLKHFTQDI